MREELYTLVVDDEQGVRFFLEKTLQQVGHTVLTASSGEEALERMRETPFGVIILDLKLGGRVDGLRVLEAVRWRWPETIVIILTAHGSLESAVAAIREGVDGYLLKPVEPEEVRQTVREALERRKRLAQPNELNESGHLLERGPFCLDFMKYQASMEGQHLELTPREFKLLALLMQKAPRVVSPQELVQVMLEYEPESLYEARDLLKYYVYRLRRKVEPDPSNPRHILTVRGVGYRFENSD